METLFVLTHATMLICLIGIICISIPNLFDNDQVEKPSVIASSVTRLKSIQINKVRISRTATLLLALFLR